MRNPCLDPPHSWYEPPDDEGDLCCACGKEFNRFGNCPRCDAHIDDDAS